jgi:hypothetical protein
MKKRSILLPLVLSLFLCLFASPAQAEAWPASREDLAAENLIEADDWWIVTGRYRPAAEKLAEVWARKNYGEDAVIRSIERVTAGTSLRVNVGKLLEGYHTLYTSTWEIQLIPQTLPDGSKQSDEVYTVSIQVLCLEQDFGFQIKQSTLVGYLPPEKTFRDLSEIWTYLKEDPRFADSLAELHTTVPEGVTEIALRTVLGDDAADIRDAWMLNADICVLLRSLPEQAAENYELIVLELLDGSILSRTPVPYTHSFSARGWEEGTLYLLFEPEAMDLSDSEYYEVYNPEISYIKATVASDGTVDFNLASSKLTLMPGGDIAVREGHYGSLYAVDMNTGEEELLIQGTAGPYGIMSYEAYLKYVPFRDDEGFYELDVDGNLLPVPFPQDEYSYPDGAYHGFSVYKPLDEHRFVYTGYGWEWDAGFGIYDLQTRTDHRFTGRGSFFGMEANMLFGSILAADANTYESSPLPESVQEQFDQVVESWWGGDPAEYSISPDGRLLALFNAKSGRGDASASTITITGIRTGRIIKAFSINNPFVSDYSCNVDFYSTTRFMLFCPSEELGSAYIYLFNVEERARR